MDGWKGLGRGLLLTGYVLGEELSSLIYSHLSAWGQGVPESFDDDVVVRSGDDGDLLGGGVADFGAIAQ